MKKIIMLTNGFPYVGGEKSLIRYEYEAIAKNNKVIICAVATEKQRELGIDESISLLDNTEVYPIDMKLNKVDYLKVAKAFFSSVFWHEEIGLLLRRKRILESTRKSLEFFVLAQKYKDCIYKNGIVNKDDEVLIYSFWNTFYAFAACLLAKKCTNIKIASRYHGYDLYDYRIEGVEHQPYKAWMNKWISRKIFVSQEGYDYYTDKYPSEENCSCMIHLGVPAAITKQKEVCSRNLLRIVSCSRMIPLKRIELTIEALATVDDEYNIEWVHYGDGEIYNSISEYAKKLLSKKKNVRFKLPGSVDNDELLRLYSLGNIHCLLSTSSHEGLPVSIMEAFSNEIPVIATDVNGVSEAVVDHYNGILLEANPTVNQVAKAIEEIAKMSDIKYKELKHNAYLTWQERFDARKNAESLAACLEGII